MIDARSESAAGVSSEPDPAIVLGIAADGQITAADSACERLTGEIASWIGRHVRELQSPSGREHYVAGGPSGGEVRWRVDALEWCAPSAETTPTSARRFATWQLTLKPDCEHAQTQTNVLLATSRRVVHQLNNVLTALNCLVHLQYPPDPSSTSKDAVSKEQWQVLLQEAADLSAELSRCVQSVEGNSSLSSWRC